jgi:hypothetical protein
LITWIMYMYKFWSTSFCSLLQTPNVYIVSSAPCYQNTINPRSSPSVRDKVSHQYKTTGIFFHILNFK